MSTTLYIALDRRIDGVQLNNDRVFLAKLVGDPASMGALCGKLGVASLCDFSSYDPQLLAEFIDDPREREPAIAKAQPIEWFNPSEALPVVKALQVHFEQTRFVQERGRKPAGKREWEPVDRTNDLMRELRDLEEALSHAENAGAKFRLYTGF
jgi:hypothetical protein